MNEASLLGLAVAAAAIPSVAALLLWFLYRSCRSADDYLREEHRRAMALLHSFYASRLSLPGPPEAPPARPSEDLPAEIAHWLEGLDDPEARAEAEELARYRLARGVDPGSLMTDLTES